MPAPWSGRGRTTRCGSGLQNTHREFRSSFVSRTTRFPPRPSRSLLFDENNLVVGLRPPRRPDRNIGYRFENDNSVWLILTQVAVRLTDQRAEDDIAWLILPIRCDRRSVDGCCRGLWANQRRAQIWLRRRPFLDRSGITFHELTNPVHSGATVPSRPRRVRGRLASARRSARRITDRAGRFPLELLVRGFDASLGHTQVPQRSRIGRKEDGGLVGHPQGGIAVVRAADVVIEIPGHVPEHHAQFVELDARYPVRTVTPQANHADLRDIGVVNRGQPAKFGNRPGIRSTQLDLHAMVRDDLDLPAITTQTFTFEGGKIMMRRVAGGLELKDGTFRAKPLQCRQVVSKATDSRRFVHALAAIRGERGAVLTGRSSHGTWSLLRYGTRPFAWVVV